MRRPIPLILASALACAGLATAIRGPDDDRLLEREAERMQQRMNERVAAFRANAEPEDPDVASWTWHRDSLVQWTANWPANEDSLHDRGKAHLVLPDGIVLHVLGGPDHGTHWLIRVWRSYPFNNPYLRSSFAGWLNAPKGLKAETGPGLGPVVRDARGAVMFRLAWRDGERPITTPEILSALLLLAAFVLLVISAWSVSGLVAQRWGAWPAVVAGTGLIIAIRWAGLAAYPIAPFDRMPLFGPELYAAASWQPSLGDLLVNALLWLVIARIAHLRLRRYEVTADLGGAAIAFALTGMVLGSGAWVTEAFVGLVQDSSVDLDLFDLQDLGIYSVIALVCVALLVAGWLLIADALVRPFAGVIRSWPVAIAVLLAIAASIALHDHWGVVDLALVLWPLPLLALAIARRGRYGLSHALFTLLVIALLGAHVLLKHDRRREHRDRLALAERLLTERDPVVELLFRQTAPRLRHDAAVYALLRDTLCDPAQLDARIRQPYFTGYWERYDVRLHVFGADGSLRCATSPDPPRSLSAAEGFTRTLAVADMPELYIDAAPGERPFYHARVAVMASDTSPPAQLLVELHPRIAPEGQGFPELLLNDPEGIGRRMGRYAFARYGEGRLMEHRGFAFPLRWSLDPDEDHVAEMELDGWDLLAFGEPSGSLVVLGTPSLTLLQRVTTFSWLFAFFGLVLAAFIGLREVLRARGLPPLGIGGKVRLALLVFAGLMLVFFGLGSQRSLARLYTARNDAALLEKTRSILVELRGKLEGVERLVPARADYLAHLLSKFSNIFFTDINVYGPDGRLLATSRPQVFDAGLLGRRMDPVAFHRLAVDGRTEFLQVEAIGGARYRSAYMPLRNKQGGLLAYVNLPSFARQGELDQERGTLVTAIVNLFVLLLALSLLAGVFISSWTTQPLELLKRGLGRIALTGANEPIAYAGRDEVGELVRVYNRKVEELRESAERLARSERESAWKEMARQVAHEIKNPLTPMKLSIQHFQRTWTPEGPGATEKLRSFGESLVQQIDALSRIAGEFSAFAQMPAAQERVFDLREVAEAGIALFKGEANAVVVLDAPSPMPVKADRDQLLRALNNLLKNAVQSIPEGRPGRIEVGIRREGGMVVLHVSDNGEGIAPDARERIFTPSFTTKSSGMGLGLAMVKRIVEQASGRVWFGSEVGRGSTFFIELPLHP